jgi:hypothetical protein
MGGQVAMEEEEDWEGVLGNSPFQLTAEDMYMVDPELMALGSDPCVTQLQFKIFLLLEMLEMLEMLEELVT